MILTGNRRLSPNIWPKTPNQAKGIEDMIRIV